MPNKQQINPAFQNHPIMDQNSHHAAAAPNPAANWWPDVHATSLSSWSSTISNTSPSCWNPSNPNSNNSSCDQEDVSMSTSFTNASNHSGLTTDSSRQLVESMVSNDHELNGETVSDNHHLWSHLLLSVGSGGELQNNTDVGENILNAFSSKNSSRHIFEPACDYLKKLDNSWEFASPTSLANFQKNFNGFSDNLYENEKLSKLSNLVNNWSLAPPDSVVNQQFDDQYSDSRGFDMNIRNGHAAYGAVRGLHRKTFNGNEVGYQVGLENAIVGDKGRYYDDGGSNHDSPRRSFVGDVETLGSCLSKPLVDISASKPILKTLNLSDCKKQAPQASYPLQPTISKCSTLTRSNGRGHGANANEGKKKRSEDNSGALLKKPKLENSTVSSAKIQVPKAKLGDKITALQQIVSPFGKTDTASVLWEAIGYIKFLQEQVQLLSNPYMKTNANKDLWGVVLDRKDRDVKIDLKSRGLCLVPISCTPQVYRENNGSDYWTPTYRGCLYR